MKRLKNYTLLPLALAFILLGAALPYLTSQLQDSRISGLQKDSELSSVNLTLRQKGDVGPVLQLMSKKHTEGSWNPTGKSEITGIIYEPWHYRYVGREAAEQIHASGVCLEEYLASG